MAVLFEYRITMEDLSKKTVMVYDQGLFMSIAITLAKTFGKVYYYVPSENAFPKMNLGKLGTGIPEIEVVDSYWPYMDEIDLWVFPDLGAGAMQDYLRSQGHNVWGSGKGEMLERDRVKTKKIMQNMGLPVGAYTTVKGVTQLRDFLRKHKNQIVKLSDWRGHMETFSAPNYKQVEPRLDELVYNLKAWSETTEFIVEQRLDNKVEVGIDTYCIDGVFPKKLLCGIEVKAVGYVGGIVKYDDLPEPVTAFSRAMKTICQKGMYRGSWSDETRIGKDHVGFMIDACMRTPEPPGSLYQVLYTNLAEIMWNGAQGKCIEPVAKAKYGVEIIIYSSWANTECLPIDFPAQYANLIKLRNCCKVGKQWYIVPQAIPISSVGAVVGYGGTIKAAVEMAEEVAKTVEGYAIDIPDGALAKAQEQLKLGESMGINILNG